MDFLDICIGKYFQTHTGRYFKCLPNNTYIDPDNDSDKLYEVENTNAIYVDYEYVDPTEWHYKNLLGNLTETSAANATIKTKEPITFSPRSYFLLDDGRLCQVTSVTQDTSAAQREAARLFPVPLGTEYVLRLTQVENPWEI